MYGGDVNPRCSLYVDDTKRRSTTNKGTLILTATCDQCLSVGSKRNVSSSVLRETSLSANDGEDGKNDSIVVLMILN